jgi:hypothetical protein
MLESKIQSKIIKRYEDEGFYVIKLSVTNKAGIPDLIAIPKDANIEFIEVKQPGKKTSALQDFRIKELTNHGIKTSVQYD